MNFGFGVSLGNCLSVLEGIVSLGAYMFEYI